MRYKFYMYRYTSYWYSSSVATVLQWLPCLPLDPRVAGSNPAEMDFKGDKNPQHTFFRMGSKAGKSHVVRFYGMSKNPWSPTGMNRLNSHFLCPSPGSRAVSGDGQSALVDKLRVSPSRSRLLTGSHRYHSGIVYQAQGYSAETAVSPHHNNQSTMYKWWH
jgi:hypothetical protein